MTIAGDEFVAGQSSFGQPFFILSVIIIVHGLIMRHRILLIRIYAHTKIMIKKEKLLSSGGVLMIMMLVSKIIGALFRIPLTNIVGAEGMGLYQLVYPFYALLLTVSSGGIPTAVCKVVASKKDDRAALNVLKYSLLALASLGFLVAAGVFFARGVIAKLQGNPKAAVAYVGIAPAILFVSVLACFRGYYQGKKNMIPSGVSQIVEQTFKLVFGLSLAVALLPRGVEYGVMGALMGITLSEVAATAFMAACYAGTRRRHFKRTKIKLAAALEAGELVLPPVTAELKGREIIKNIYLIALPVTLSSLILPLTQVIDSVMIVNLLSATMPVETATALYGLLNGPIGSLINMPTVLTMSLSVSLLPQIASSEDEKKGELGGVSLKVSFLIALPCTIIFAVFPREILTLLYHRGLSAYQIEVGTHLMRFGSLSVLYITLIQVATSCLQGVDKAHIPAVNLVVGGIVKVVLTLVLLKFFGIYGAMAGTVACYGITAILDYWSLRKFMRLQASFKWLLAVPLALAAFFAAKLLSGLVSFWYSEVICMALAALVYLGAVFALRLVRLKEIF